MLQSHHYELLDKLRFGKSAQERKAVSRDLIALEEQGKFEEDDHLALLAERDIVFQIYAVGALGRRKSQKGIPRLKRLYKESTNPLMLIEILSAFLAYQSDDFVSVVTQKLKQTRRKTGARTKEGDSNLDRIFDNDFIRRQILIPSLKYLQATGDLRIEKTIREFLEDGDASVRWHALLVYDKLALPVKEKRLQKMERSDSSALVREQAAIMLDKLKRTRERQNVNSGVGAKC